MNELFDGFLADFSTGLVPDIVGLIKFLFVLALFIAGLQIVRQFIVGSSAND